MNVFAIIAFWILVFSLVITYYRYVRSEVKCGSALAEVIKCTAAMLYIALSIRHCVYHNMAETAAELDSILQILGQWVITSVENRPWNQVGGNDTA